MVEIISYLNLSFRNLVLTWSRFIYRSHFPIVVLRCHAEPFEGLRNHPVEASPQFSKTKIMRSKKTLFSMLRRSTRWLAGEVVGKYSLINKSPQSLQSVSNIFYFSVTHIYCNKPHEILHCAMLHSE